jgi:hypothetical protein
MSGFFKLQDKKVVPCEPGEWTEWTGKNKKIRTVAETNIGGLIISTVFWGMPRCCPVDFFETKVYQGSPSGEDAERFVDERFPVQLSSTYEDAEQTHIDMLSLFMLNKNELKNPWKLLAVCKPIETGFYLVYGYETSVAEWRDGKFTLGLDEMFWVDDICKSCIKEIEEREKYIIERITHWSFLPDNPL